MKISQAYATRPDLSLFQKLSFSIDDHLKQNQHAKALYRWGFFLPPKVRILLDQVWVNLGVLPLFFLFLCGRIALAIFPSKYWLALATELILFTATIITIEVFFPYFGWGLLLMFCEFFLGFWFLDLMKDYDNVLFEELMNSE